MHQMLAQSFTIQGDRESYSVQGPLHGWLANTTIGNLIVQLLTYVFMFAGIGLLLMIISAGFTMMLSAGDTKKLEKGRATLTNAIIGFIIIFAAFWIVQALGIVFGWDTYIGQMFH